MTWAELKKAIEAAGVAETDEISRIECDHYHGSKTISKCKLGNSLKLVETVTADEREAHGCAS